VKREAEEEMGAVMTASINVDDPAHWRGRAVEARPLVDKMKDEPSRQMMLQIVEGL
jgi:hypothetical protein